MSARIETDGIRPGDHGVLRLHGAVLQATVKRVGKSTVTVRAKLRNGQRSQRTVAVMGDLGVGDEPCFVPNQREGNR